SIFHNDPPLVEVIYPSATTVIPIGVPAPITVSASDTNDFLDSVALFVDSKLIASSNQAPLSVHTLLTPGLHQVYATARDNFGVSSTSAPIELRIAVTNDAFDSRTSLSGLPTSVLGANFAATAEPGEPAHAGRRAAKSVWWSWTASSDA